MKLNEIFSKVAVKKLTKIDLPDRGSNQHEVQGVASIRSFFGEGDCIREPIDWHIFSDEKDVVSYSGNITFYDSRRNKPERSAEWRMYYSGDVLSNAEIGDSLFLVRLDNGEIHALVFPSGSSWEKNAYILFEGLQLELPDTYTVYSTDQIPDHEIEFVKERILFQLGLDHTIKPVDSDKEIITSKFGCEFPSTAEMSAFARSQVDFEPADPRVSPDDKLLNWISREDSLFRALENVIVQKRLKKGISEVDEFIQYSLSVQNRRKSRMGYAFEHHLRALFDVFNLKYTWQAETERGNKADFIFPGEREYHDPEYDTNLLVMLGAKSTIKERWRQVLEAADRIPVKHLCTLEPGLSLSLTDSIHMNSIQLVIPEGILSSYENSQKDKIINIEYFLDFVKSIQ